MENKYPKLIFHKKYGLSNTFYKLKFNFCIFFKKKLVNIKNIYEGLCITYVSKHIKTFCFKTQLNMEIVNQIPSQQI